ncbi:hypothetical protein F4802DRAFT_619008 [Xylaria palmicola]|nr:hypothetical protein F4802DRAFT_619008 [Xylaria palmicola]
MEYPRRDPKYYNDPLPEMLGLDRPHEGDDFDRLFFEEAIQKSSLAGYMWQLTSLNRWLWFPRVGLVSGGHLRRDAGSQSTYMSLFDENLIKVDETKWFSFFRKGRWYDLSSDPSVTKPVPKGGPWSVDNPRVWSVMRIAIELADRVLKALIKDRHSAIETLLFGRVVPWADIPLFKHLTPFPNAQVLLSAEMEAHIAQAENTVPWKHPASDLAPDALQALMYERLESYNGELSWTFMYQRDPGMVAGRTMPDTEEPIVRIILISTEVLRHLCEGDLTLAEMYIGLYTVAVTIVHELVHSTRLGRLVMDRPLRNDPGVRGDFRDDIEIPLLFTEPFIDFDAASEMGQGMEQRIFGGETVYYPSGNCIAVRAALRQWPNALSLFANNSLRVNPNHPTFGEKSQLLIEEFTAMDCCRLLSSAFWDDDTRPRKSDNFFHRSRIFSSISNAYPMHEYYQAPKNWGGIEVDETNMVEWRPGEAELVAAWRERQRQWRSYRRDWYDVYKTDWLSSPWGYESRMPTDLFIDAYQKKDEFLGSVAVWRLRQAMDWQSQSAFLDNLPSATNRSHNWIFFTLSLLMDATMPVRSAREEEQPSEIPAADVHRHLPSSAVREIIEANEQSGGGDENTYNPTTSWVLSDPRTPARKRPRNVCFDPFIGDMVEVTDPSQMDYVVFALMILGHLRTSGAVVSRLFYDIISRLTMALRQSRQRLESEYPLRHRVMWSDAWDFHMPSYRPHHPDWIRWMPEMNKWVQVD